GLDEVDIAHPAARRMLPGPAQHPRRDVSPDRDSTVRHPSGGIDGRRAGTAPDVEHPLAWHERRGAEHGLPEWSRHRFQPVFVPEPLADGRPRPVAALVASAHDHSPAASSSRRKLYAWTAPDTTHPGMKPNWRVSS